MTAVLNGRISERTLRMALRIRAEAVEIARRDLAAALHDAEATARHERAPVAAISEEAEAATSLDSGDLAVEAFAAWLPQGRRNLAAARARRDEVEAKVVLARASLAAARSAEAASETLLARYAEANRARVLRAEQAILDEAARRGAVPPLHRDR